MNLLIISGSQRTNSQSAKVAQFIADNSVDFAHASHIELCRFDLPFWDGEEETKSHGNNAWPMIGHKLRKADALVLITPEWGGMATPILKNFLLMCDQAETAHKPALLVSVVGGISGAYPIAELRMNALKNNKIVATPDHLIIRNVEQVLNKDQAESTRDNSLRERIAYSLYMLHEYALALKNVRLNHESQRYPKQQEYNYGM